MLEKEQTINQKWIKKGLNIVPSQNMKSKDKIEQKMDKKWTENGQKLDRNWTENAQKLDRKQTENGQILDQKWTFLLVFQGSHAYLGQRKWTKNAQKIVDRKQTENGKKTD